MRELSKEEMRQYVNLCKIECEEAEECGDLEDRLEAAFKLGDAQTRLKAMA
jgi:hypothetical protein